MADLTIEILEQIRDGIGALRGELKSEIGELRGEMSGLRVEVNEANQKLGRVEQGLNDLGRFMRSIAVELTEYEKFHKHHVEILEKDVADMRRRLEVLEKRSA